MDDTNNCNDCMKQVYIKMDNGTLLPTCRLMLKLGDDDLLMTECARNNAWCVESFEPISKKRSGTI